MLRYLLCLPWITLALATAADPPRYPRGDLLIEPGEIAKPAVAKKHIILDARKKEKYLAGHMPGAVWLDHDAWGKAFNDEPDAGAWSKRVGGLGITPDSLVVVYDDAMAKDAARVWFILGYWGVNKVKLVNGGWPAYESSGGPVEKLEVKPVPVAVKLTAQEKRLATKENVLDVLKKKDAQIIDTRSEKEFCGDAKTAKRTGAMPGAIHLEWVDALDARTQRFKSPDDLAKMFKDAGIDLTKPAVTHCQGGGRAAVMAFTMELMGARNVRNYYKSWAEWGNSDDTPIITPKPKK